MRFGYPQEPPTLDPLAAGGASAATRDILRPVLPALFALDEKLRPRPELAARFPGRADFAFDPFTVTVRLRAAEWSDGKAITSGDVRFSWTKLRDGPTGYRYRFLREVETPSSRTLRLRFDRPVRRWWALFSIDDMVLPAHGYSAERWKEGPTVSGGPFVFDGWTRGLSVKLRRNDTYGRVVPLAGIDVMFVPDDETRLQLLGRDDLDAAFAEGESNLGRRAKAHGFETRATPLDGSDAATGAFGPTWWEIGLDPSRLSPSVAHAVIEALNPALVAEILEDSGRTMNGIPPDFTVTRDVPEPWRGRGSAARAKARLDAGGRPGGTERARFQLAYAKGGASAAIARFVHFRLDEIGVIAELVGLEPDTFESEWVKQGRSEVLLRLRRGADAPDAASYPGVADDVTAAETTVARDRVIAGPVVGLAGDEWADAQRGLVQAATVAPLARVRSWIIGRGTVHGPFSTGAANGPFWNADGWSIDP
jgi:ABC-type transport system substrate-binding protein